jgi:hypothetical protein
LANESSGKVVPRALSAASPIGTSSNARLSGSRRSSACSTSSVAALISGPMPSPCMTTRRTGAVVFGVGEGMGDSSGVIPGRAEGASPESISTIRGYGFRTAALRLPE